MSKKEYVSVSGAAELMGISRTAILKKIYKGEIKAEKVGNNYIIDKRNLGLIYQDITPQQKSKITKAVKKAVKDYKEVLQKLSKE